jgi:hypothetical protein
MNVVPTSKYRYAHAKIVVIVHGSAGDKGEILQNKTVLDAAFQLGKKLFTDTAENTLYCIKGICLSPLGIAIPSFWFFGAIKSDTKCHREC